MSLRVNIMIKKFENYEIGYGRTAVFYDRKSLLIVKEDDLCYETLRELDLYLEVYPETVYVFKDERLIGILTYGDISRILQSNNSTAYINRDFRRIEFEENINKEYLTIAFGNIMIQSMPIVIDGTLYGEYRVLHVNQTNHICWEAYKEGLISLLKRNGINKLCIKDEKLFNILKSITNGFVHVSQYEKQNCFTVETRESFLAQVKENSGSLGGLITDLHLFIKAVIEQMMDRCVREDISVFYFEPPNAKKIQLSDRLTKEISKHIKLEEIVENDALLKELYGEKSKSIEYIKSGAYTYERYIDMGPYYALCDSKNPFYTVINGQRITTDIHFDESKRTIHIFGSCVTRGKCVDDSETIASFLQRIINYENGEFKVSNRGVVGSAGCANDFLYATNVPLQNGDVVMFLAEYPQFIKEFLKEKGAICLETSDVLGMSNDKRWFLDNLMHLTPYANSVIAKYIWENYKKHYSPYQNKKRKFIISEYENYKLENSISKWINEVENEIKTKWSDRKKRGAIVMNCNPFSLGHRHLIEFSSKCVDQLVVFVVQEDKSVFRFKDRIDLVRQGTADIENVLVVASGNHIISTTTFPEYFEKNSMQGKIIDASEDITIFGKVIARRLGITVRFAGEEPNDTVTRIYNEQMRDILPAYGVEFKEIKRKTIKDGTVISATRIRNAVCRGELESIRDMIPDVTYSYLKTMDFNDGNKNE